MKTVRPTFCVLIATFGYLHLSEVNTRALDDPYKGQIDQMLELVDSLLKEGITEHLNSTPMGGQIGGTKFQTANDIISKAWKMAVTARLNVSDPEEFNRVAEQYLLLHVRATSSYDNELKEVLMAFGGQLPDDPILNYIYGLALFRQAESSHTPTLYDEALPYLNKAISLNPNFPEAYWVHSQILAIKGGNIEGVKHDFAQIRKCEALFSPKLYLYDIKTMSIIKNAAHSM